MSSEPNQPNEDVVIPRTRDLDGKPVYETHLTPTDDSRPKVIETKLPAVIPLVFIPGIMGTNLKNKKTGEAVWRPPNMSLNLADILGVVSALATWGFKGPKTRQRILKAEDLTVDDSGSIDTGKSGLHKETARKRGWGSVLRTSYNPVMALLEARTDHIVAGRKLQSWWADEALRQPAEFGEETGKPTALTEEELTRAARYDYDVWCAGYNWLQPNRQSAEDLKQYIENTVLRHYREQKPPVPAEKVILVTHSMGGLVARALTNLVGYENVLGVVHGVQPATGAPAIYHHMRSGYEGPEQLILGANAGEVTAVVANSAGALELCPTFDHRGGKPWLFLQDEQGNVVNDADGLACAYPRGGNPYEEIYKNPAWFGLVPEQNTKFLDLSDGSGQGMGNPRDWFNDRIGKVEDFHRAIGGKYHTDTYLHYGADGSRAMHSWQDIVWRGGMKISSLSNSLMKDDENGSYRHRSIRNAPELTPVAGKGDGTVSVFSGEAPREAGVKASFRHGSDGKGTANIGRKGYDHQGSYNDTRAQWAALYGIIKITQLADWHPNDQS
ncbi:esterase/lipase family protein [Ralstonia pseudosolanacearum]|uniref:esterase/lipase family protein n=1 Tax=Ralstonia pseudosolanacearum TaxID=1310165 RepID=UPI00048F99AB|nr:membrane protein [Ralstonia pseudosolanacearum]